MDKIRKIKAIATMCLPSGVTLRGGRLFRALLCSLAAYLCALPATTMAQDSDLWSATLTVGGDLESFNLLGCAGGDAFGVFGNPCSDTDNLSDNDFDLDGETYRVNTIHFNTSTGVFSIQIIPALPADLTSANLFVEAGGQQFGVTRDDTVVSGRTMLQRANAALPWLEGSRVAMKLIRGTPPTADTTAPTVTSILRQDPSTASTDADALTWRVTFSEPVQNVDVADFAVVGPTAMVTAVMSVTSGVASGPAVWDVTASGGDLADLDGGALLNIAAGQNIEDLAGNALTALSPTGVSQNYVVANPPRVTSILRQNPSTASTNANALTWRVTFSEAVTGVGVADFAVDGTTATLAVAEVSGETGAWDVTASGGDLVDLNGEVTLGFAAGQDIQDVASNALENTTPTGMNQGYILDNAPKLVSVERFQPAAMTTDANGLTWRVRFSEPVQFVDASDFAVSGTTASVVYLSTANGTNLDDDWYVSAGGGDLADVDGTVTLGWAGFVLIRDATDQRFDDFMANTPLGTSDASYTVFNRPRVSSIVRQNPANSFTFEDTLTWRVTFTEAVNVDAADFAVDGTTATLAVALVSGETGAWDVTASGGDLADLNGEVTLRFAGDQNIQDLAGNGLTKTTPLVTNENVYRLSNVAAPDPGVTPPPVVGPPTVTISGPSTVMEGTAATFTLTLNAAAPTGGLPVSVEVSEVEDTEQEGVISSIVLDSRTVTVTAGDTQAMFTFVPEDDAVDDDDRVLTARIFAATSDAPPVFEPVTYTVTIGGQTYTVTSSRPVDSDADTPIYFVGDPSTATVMVTDDDERGIAIAPDNLTVAEGGTTEYTVALTSEPAQQSVVLTPRITSITPPNVAHDVTVFPRTLTFTRDNWDEPQTVTVRAVRDADAENDQVEIRYTADGGDYDGLTTEVVSVAVTETVVPQVTIAAAATPVPESFTAVFTLTRTDGFMDEALTVDVALTETGDAIAAGDEGTQQVITFVAGRATAELRVRTVADDVDEPDSALTATVVADTADPMTYTVGSASAATVTVVDDEVTPRVTLTFVDTDPPNPPGLAEISEADEDSVTLRAQLSTPSSEETQVTVTVPADAAAALTFAPDPPVLTIPAGATQSTNTVTLTAIDNDVADAPSRLLEIGGTVTNAHGAGAVTIARLLLNDDDPGVRVTPEALTVSEAAPEGFYDVVLDRVPTADVTVTPSSNNTDVTFAPAVLTFTPENWQTPQRVTVTAAMDADTADDTATISHTVASGDIEGVVAGDVTVTVTDDAPTVRSAGDGGGMSTVSVGQPTLTLDFDEGELVTMGREPPNPAAFTVTVNGTEIPVLSVEFGSVVLTLEHPLPTAGQGVVAYDPDMAGDNPLQRTDGQEVGSFEVPFTVVDDRAMAVQQALEAYLPRFGRTVGDQIGAMISDRIATMRSTTAGARAPGLEFVLGGQALPRITFAAATLRSTDQAPSAASADAQQVLDTVAHTLFGQHGGGDDFGYDTSPDPADIPARLYRAGTDAAAETGSQALTAETLLHGTRFMLTAPAGERGGQLALWGRVSHGGFNRAQPHTTVDGEATTGMLGMDYARDRLNFGAILSQSKGTAATQDANAASSAIESDLTAFTPWVSFNATEQITTWASLGYGTGNMTLTRATQVPATTGIDWRMAAMGARGNLVTRDTGFSLDLAADAMWVSTSLSDTGLQLASVSSDVTRARLGLAAAWQYDLVSGITLTPRLEMGLRHDGGDAETGSGLEIGGGLVWTDPERGVSMDLAGRTLALHEDGDFEDWGLSAGLNYDPHPATGQGFSMTMARSLGGSASGGVEAFLGSETFPNATENGGNGTWSIEAAYGMNRKSGMVGSPYTRLSGDGSVEAARLGYRIKPDAAHAAGINVDLWVEPPVADGEARARANLEWRW